MSTVTLRKAKRAHSGAGPAPYEGLKLGMNASIEIEKGKYAYSNLASVIVGANLESIKLVLTVPNE